MRTVRTAAASVRPVWLAISLAASVVGGCQLGGGTYYLEVHNRTAVPILMQGSSWAGSNRFIASCESATLTWGRGAVSNVGSSSPPTPPADAVMVEIPSSLSPPADPSNDVHQILIVSSEGAFGYRKGDTQPSMPPCEGRPLID
jgi:hypothetical protein